MSASKKKVNLLVREGFEYTSLGRILAWSLGAGRVIVILTELIVVLAFVSRFWLDRTLTDLNAENASKKLQIEASSRFESDFRNAQARLSSYKKLSTSSLSSAIVGEITALLPRDVSLSKISLSDGDITIEGISLSESGLAGFIGGLQSSTSFSRVTLANVSISTEGRQSLVFSIRGSVGENKKEGAR